MNLQIHKIKIDRYLGKSEKQPLIVDVQNYEDLSKLITEYTVGNNRVISASKYSHNDELPNIDSLLNDILQSDQPVFLTGLSTFLKLQGKDEFDRIMNEIINVSAKEHIIIFTYQCENYLSSFSDPRLLRRIDIIPGDKQQIPKIILVNSELFIPNNSKKFNGIQNFADAVEKNNDNEIYIVTSKSRKKYSTSLLPVSVLCKSYDAISEKDPLTLNILEKIGNDDQWNYALGLFKKHNKWYDIIDSELTDHRSLERIIFDFQNMNPNKQWLYFVALKLCDINSNSYIGNFIVKSNSLNDFIHNIYAYILNIDVKNKKFWDFYFERKEILKNLNDFASELNDYCNLVFGKEKDAICYLTDNTQKEREVIFKYLDMYGADVNRDKLLDILSNVYPDIYEYLQPYNFDNQLLNNYFQQYKYQKVINKVFPDFVKTVEEQAKKREYNYILSPRASYIEKLDKKDCQLYFIDALGVEYLGYILEECHKLKLMANVTVCRAELPSITSKNTGFVDEFKDYYSLKDIDQIKHHGKYGYDYYHNSKLPVYLIKELEIIKVQLEKIRNSLKSGEIHRVFIISDHGASRLSVLYDTENIWQMSKNGEHSGRCCLKGDIDEQPNFAADADDFWALANYDRFKGGRKANVEVHGGATLEEICVPIIELTYKDEGLKIYLMSADSASVDYNKVPEIKVSFKKKAELKIFATSEISDVKIIVNNKCYSVQDIGNNFYSVKMPDIKKAGTYFADIYSEDNKIAENMQFIIVKEGHIERDLL